MDRNVGELALACAVLLKKGYTDIQLADLVGWEVDQVNWMAMAHHNEALHGLLDACDSASVYIKLMRSNVAIRKATVKEMGSGLVTKKLLTMTTALVGRRAKRNGKRKGE